MQVPLFDYQRQLESIYPEVNKTIKKIFDSGELILGNEVSKFENNFSKYIGFKYGIGVNSGTDAIKIALKSLEIGCGDEVITIANTAVPTISAIRETGALPKFVDIKNDFTIDENKVEKAITSKTKIILPVHLYGQPCNMKEILKIAKKYNLKIVEDCCQATGAMINHKKVGSFGDIACFSFYPTKNLGAYGDAGMIVTSILKIADKCRMLRIYGMRAEYYSQFEGYNSRLDEIQASILNLKLKYLEKWNKKRRQIARFYLTEIKNKKIILPIVNNIKEHAFHLFVIRCQKREKLLKYLTKNKIGWKIHYPWPIHIQKAYHYLGYTKGSLVLTEKYAKEIISLPIFPELTPKEIKYVIEKLNSF